MNNKAFCALICLLFLQACAPNKKTTTPNSLPSIASAPAENSYEHRSRNRLNDQTSEPSTEANNRSARKTDLLERVRAGFAFPKLHSQDVNKHVKWVSEHPTYLENLFARGEPFLYFIIEEIERRGLPMELALLPAVESAYDVGAVSRSKAAGLWQFVPATGKGFGLRQDWWYDGRHDPYSSTFAALDYLEQLHKMFDGDWFIALAAYNAGPGTLRREIARAKRKGKKTDYLSLKLRQETRRYVPKLMGLREILSNPRKYGVELPLLPSQPYFEVVKLPGQIDLIEFAKQSQIDKGLLKTLNRGFKRWATPPEGPHRILIPIETRAPMNADPVALARAAIAESKPLNYRSHRIKMGETLSHIARKYGVSVTVIQTTNRLRGHNIRAGRNLIIPISAGYGSQDVASASSPKATMPQQYSGDKIKHRVTSGDTLWSIAKHYRVDLKELMSWNNLDSNDVLSLNQLLTVFIN
ncbi:MAG: transglycosylase SLT domain-containing protein [Gammaproteobacteria bacterium]|nr:transglycosylase SLT domain-containing protein [Gammaproteobacteria bacterium]